MKRILDILTVLGFIFLFGCLTLPLVLKMVK